MTDQLARKILKLMPFHEALRNGDILEHCSVTEFCPLNGIYYRLRWYATYNYYDGRTVRIEVARKWGKTYRRVDDVSYETLQLVRA